MGKTYRINGRTIIVVDKNEKDKYITESDAEMDARASEAIKVAIEKARFLKKPIAKYDSVNKRAYVEYPDGEIKYVD